MAEIPASFKARDKRMLHEFRGAWLDLCERNLMREPPKVLSVDITGQEFTHLKGVDEDHLRSFLTSLRQFMLAKDATSFSRACQILCIGSRSEDLHRWVGHAREVWEATLSSRYGITVNGRDPTLKEILDLLHYGDINHRQPDKVAALAAMPTQDRALLRMKAISLTWPILQALGIVSEVIRHVEEDRIHEIPPGPQPGSGRHSSGGSFGQIVDS